MKKETYLIEITNEKVIINYILLKNVTKEEALEELNSIWNADEKKERYYTYKLIDMDNNTLYSNHR